MSGFQHISNPLMAQLFKLLKQNFPDIIRDDFPVEAFLRENPAFDGKEETIRSWLNNYTDSVPPIQDNGTADRKRESRFSVILGIKASAFIQERRPSPHCTHAINKTQIRKEFNNAKKDYASSQGHQEDVEAEGQCLDRGYTI